MQIVVISDTHGRNEVFQELRLRHPQASAYLHCGDSETDEYTLDGFVSVQGNNDYYSSHPMELIINVKDLKVYMTHGQYLRSNNRFEALVQKARDYDCTLALYGHTHVFDLRVIDGVTLLNPGSLHHNRDGSQPCYALVTIDEGRIHVERIDYPKTKTK